MEPVEGKAHECERCGATFGAKQTLQRHLQRKHPCIRIANRCKRCGRNYSTPSNLTRHVKTCIPPERAADADLRAEIAELRALLVRAINSPGLGGEAKHAAAAAAAVAAGAPATVVQVNNTVNNTVNNVQVSIRPWGAEAGRIEITAKLLNEVFEGSRVLRDYCGMKFRDQMDENTAMSYVVEGMVELARRAHAEPEARNIYLNPRRSDQVLVYDGAGWRALALTEGVRRAFDEIGEGVRGVVLSDKLRAELTPDVETGVTGVHMVYGAAPERVALEARGQMAAHLTNMAPMPPGAALAPLAAA